jgi:hypothetical protein
VVTALRVKPSAAIQGLEHGVVSQKEVALTAVEITPDETKKGFPHTHQYNFRNRTKMAARVQRYIN